MSKRHVDYTMADLTRLKDSLFINNLPESEREHTIDAMRYARRMATTLGKDINSWNVISAFGIGDGVRVVTDLAKINKILMTYKQTDAIDELAEVLHTKSREIKKATSMVPKEIAKTKTLIDRYRSNILDYSTRLSSNYSAMSAQQNKLRELESANNGDSPVLPALQELCGNNFFKFKEFYSNSVGTACEFRFETPEVIVNAGQESELAMGSFRVVLKFTEDGPRLYVFKHKNNIISADYYSPYINSGGTICWGNGTDRAATLLAEHKYGELFEMLRQLLITYDDDTVPYRRLQEFRMSKQYKQIIDRGYDFMDWITGSYSSYYTPVKLKVNIFIDDTKYNAGTVLYARAYDGYYSKVSLTPDMSRANGYIITADYVDVPSTLTECIAWHEEVLNREEDNESNN